TPTPTIDSLMARGRWTLSALTVMPSVTLPCHMSLFHSVDPGRHGIVTNLWTPQVRPVPGLFDIAHRAGIRTGAYYNWEELRDLWRPGALDVAFFWRDCRSLAGDRRVAAEAARSIAADGVELAFVYFGYPDECAHRHGWMSAEYLEAVSNADACLGEVLASLGEGSTVIVTADHGGHERSHGSDLPEDMTIPLVIAPADGTATGGDGEMAGDVSILDVAPTIVRLLGLSAPEEWEGRAR
ncbi:MAG: sulfatase-like hydrolase/transferase, partial [Chloroflexi bacterium]|nr:sulfatase-like hydrolase/transferase [Chloroflexota bacterium]